MQHGVAKMSVAGKTGSGFKHTINPSLGLFIAEVC